MAAYLDSVLEAGGAPPGDLLLVAVLPLPIHEARARPRRGDGDAEVSADVVGVIGATGGIQNRQCDRLCARHCRPSDREGEHHDEAHRHGALSRGSAGDRRQILSADARGADRSACNGDQGRPREEAARAMMQRAGWGGAEGLRGEGRRVREAWGGRGTHLADGRRARWGREDFGA